MRAMDIRLKENKDEENEAQAWLEEVEEELSSVWGGGGRGVITCWRRWR